MRRAGGQLIFLHKMFHEELKKIMNLLFDENMSLDAVFKKKGIVKEEDAYICFVELFMSKLRKDVVLYQLLNEIEKVTEKNFNIFGGSLRRTILGSPVGGDLDISVPNGDNNLFYYLKEIGVNYELNRRGHRRYIWKGYQFDINQPKEWSSDYRNIEDILWNFDLEINSLAFNYGSKIVCDPFCVIKNRRYFSPGINWSRWKSSNSLELSILAIRLLNILKESEDLKISSDDYGMLIRLLKHKYQSFDWEQVKNRYPRGKEEFLIEFFGLIKSRVFNS